VRHPTTTTLSSDGHNLVDAVLRRSMIKLLLLDGARFTISVIIPLDSSHLIWGEERKKEERGRKIRGEVTISEISGNIW
jgi:hypothetical protein